MSKLWKLKRWLTLSQAAEYIAALAEDASVSESDLLQLALEGKITLSALFPDGTLAQMLEPVDLDAIEYEELPSLDGNRSLRLPVGGHIYYTHAGEALQASKHVFGLHGNEPYDLPLMYGEREAIETRYWSSLGHEPERASDISGTVVRGDVFGTATYFRLMGLLPPMPNRIASYYPLGQLPASAILVLRQDEIRRFVNSLSDTDLTSRDKPRAATPSARSEWPWGDYQTRHLAHLESAARKFWVNFDPADNTTAPTNEAVALWLTSRGVSKRMAEAIASILRPDGLPTGPRTT